MNTDMSKVVAAVVGFLRQAPEGRTAKERADLLVEVIQAVYDDVKFRHPEGEGLDGRDGPQRVGIGVILDAAKDYQVEAWRMSHTDDAR